jgi:ankyrin repeat protein
MQDTGWTGLMIACANNNLALAQWLVSPVPLQMKYSLNPYDVDHSDTSLLHIACKRGNVAMADWLVNSLMLDPNAPNQVYPRVDLALSCLPR